MEAVEFSRFRFHCFQLPISQQGWWLVTRDGRSLLFLTLTPLLLRKIQLRLQSAPKIFLILYSDSLIFKVWETNSDVKITFHPSVIFGFDFIIWYETSTPLRLQQINKKRTPTPLRSESDKKCHTPFPIRLRVCPSLVVTNLWQLANATQPLAIVTQQRWAWVRSGSDFDLFWPDRIGAGLSFSPGSEPDCNV